MKNLESVFAMLVLAGVCGSACDAVPRDPGNDAGTPAADAGATAADAGVAASDAGPDTDHLAYAQGDHGFVGTVEGTEAFIAVVTGLEVAMVLVVHGEDEIYERFEGELLEGYALDIQNADGTRLQAEYENDEYSGDVTLSNGDTHPFSASVTDGNVAGMFLVVTEDCTDDAVKAGWVIDGTGAQRGAARVQARFLETPVLDADQVTFGDTDYPVYKMAPPGAGGGVLIGFPDVCKTPAPAGPVPIPYPG